MQDDFCVPDPACGFASNVCCPGEVCYDGSECQDSTCVKPAEPEPEPTHPVPPVVKSCPSIMELVADSPDLSTLGMAVEVCSSLLFVELYLSLQC